MKALSFLLCSLTLLLTGCAHFSPEISENNAPYKTVDLDKPIINVWDRIREGYQIDDIDTPEVATWEKYYSERPEYFKRTAQRASKYLFFIVEEIDTRGLPTELALLPFVESSYNPLAESSAKASGLWQFIPSTGKQFKLTQDWWRDERRDPIASTNAALDYLTYLYEFQNDWLLALASYNWGEGSVRRAMEKNRIENLDTDYLSLKMPDETWNYIPKLQAIKNIVRHPENYGISLPEIDNAPYFTTYVKERSIDIEQAARFAEMSVDEFKALNPSFKRSVIPGQVQPKILLPVDKVAIFEANIKQYDGRLKSWKEYIVSKKDTIASIAKKFNVPELVLKEANYLDKQALVKNGQMLLIPNKQDAELKGMGKNILTKGKKYIVKSGDTLARIAQNHRTNIQKLMQKNGLKTASLKIGQVLMIP